MPRIRTIKPELWQDEKLAPLPPLTRLVFIGLICMADDAGRMVDNIKSIDGFIFPETKDSSRDPIESLARLGRVIRYTSASGQNLLQISNWTTHQKVDNPSKYTLPAPISQDQAGQQLTEPSRDPIESLAKSSRYDLRPTTNDLRPIKGFTEDELSVLTHFTTTHPRRKCDDSTAHRYIGAALKRFSVEDLKQAIDGNAKDPWHIEKKKHELSYVLRNAEMISSFIEKARPEVLEVDADGDPILSSLIRMVK